MNQNLPAQRANSFAPGPPDQANRAFSINEMGLRDILSTIFKYKSMILVSFVLITCLCCAAVIFYLKFLYEPVYEAKSLILVRPGWESQNIELTPDRRQTNVNNPELVATEVGILQSRDLKEKVINTMKPEVIFPDMGSNIPLGLSVGESALYRFEKNFSVKSSAGANIVEASFKGPDPAIDAKVVNELVNDYMDKRGDTYRNPKVFLFLDQKTGEYRQKLAEAQSKLKAFQDQSGIVSFDEQRTFLLNRQRQIADASHDTEYEIAQLQEKIAELERQLPTLQTTSMGDTTRMAELETRLLALELQEKELVFKYKEDNPFVTSVREQIKMTKNYIDARRPGSIMSVDPAYKGVQRLISENKADLSGLKVKQKGLDEQLKALTPEISAFESQESKYKQLARDVADNEENYKTYISKLEESRIHDELDRQKMTNVSVLEQASVPIIPNNLPKPLMVYVLIALLLGIAGSIGLAFSMARMSPGMSTPAQAERRLELPVLAVVADK
ncbi:MAG: GumC family protein [Syntrophobacteraceae bacterium]